ncbi:short-chain dehydrogenase/reductase family protein [Favolaschia claudopus]|uniref:Short-chain dehydrogenase/reductase family protein n=1 Tax=Favolaschia claudopus TaxID=2862362 RepID=A0AAW0EKG9_9AGAR
MSDMHMDSLPQFSRHSTADEVADALSEYMKGKNVVITGTSLNGVGFNAAQAIAKYASLVIITGYNADRLKASENAIRKEMPSANIRSLTLDLSSLTKIREAADEVNSYPEPIHVLIHNAAAAIVPLKLTEDNFDRQIATAHIGPFLFTKLIADKILASATTSISNYIPRVVMVASRGHTGTSDMNFELFKRLDDAEAEAQSNLKYLKAMNGFEIYFQAKSANVLFAKELVRRSGGRINAFSLHPGEVLTNIALKEESKDSFIASGTNVEILSRNQSLIFAGTLNADGTVNTERWDWKTLAEGAATTVAAAFDPRLDDVPGAYLVDCNVTEVAPHCDDPANAEKLWVVTEEGIGERFTFQNV